MVLYIQTHFLSKTFIIDMLSKTQEWDYDTQTGCILVTIVTKVDVVHYHGYCHYGYVMFNILFSVLNSELWVCYSFVYGACIYLLYTGKIIVIFIHTYINVIIGLDTSIAVVVVKETKTLLLLRIHSNCHENLSTIMYGFSTINLHWI